MSITTYVIAFMTMFAACGAVELGDNGLVKPEFFDIRPKNVIIKPVINGDITFHGGATMSQTTTVYYIWYGNFTTSTKNIVYNYTKGLNTSVWWGINRKYNVGDIVLGSSKAYTTNLKKTLTQGDIEAQIKLAISTNLGPTGGSTSAIYVVMTDKTIDQREGGAGFCTDYCGWHTYMVYNGKKIKYSWVGSSLRCPSSCSTLSSSGYNAPNANFEADSMVSILGHELAETTSDPELNAWYDAGGNENADKCAWTFGNTTTGTSANVNGIWNEKIGKQFYYVQRNWGLFPTQGCYQ
jgi:hypothetical protein